MAVIKEPLGASSEIWRDDGRSEILMMDHR